MINLLRYREQADYGSRTDIEPCTGREAYRRYMKQAVAFVIAVGGAVVWQGAPKALLLGPPEERWDLALLVEVPVQRGISRDGEQSGLPGHHRAPHGGARGLASHCNRADDSVAPAAYFEKRARTHLSPPLLNISILESG